MSARRPLLAVDAPWVLYRAFFALPGSITGADGRPVNALLGAANALLAAVGELRPRAVAVCFGAEDAGYRTAAYPGYHAHREPMPADLRHQFGLAPELFAAFGWSVLDAGELEADDLLGALARREAGAAGVEAVGAPTGAVAGESTLILTADRDLYQAVSPACSVVHLKGGALERVDVAGVQDRYGIGPALVPDLIALRGDPSDGIPGAPRIGAKTAASLLTRFGSLEGVLAAAADPDSRELRPKLAETLREHAARLRVFREIATLQPVDVAAPPDGQLDPDAAAAVAHRLGMGQLARRLTDAARAAGVGGETRTA
ncbi:MAG TPA: 5'-3' exonuclease H3TH domain-containing protein [Solirubrobacteraceae bacterium]|nr:5'-3' exonuclease H3TH domain-containing protein [Solirubrobacteraceae bacterium]